MRKSAPLFCALLLSLSARRAWIEIVVVIYTLTCRSVALRKESVDRNSELWANVKLAITVALRKESVDRNNKTSVKTTLPGTVALRKESVDRNLMNRPPQAAQAVALRKESVDRNAWVQNPASGYLSSLSARRAWIEIPDLLSLHTGVSTVALRKESVDRNHAIRANHHKRRCRSPQGERG